MNRLWTLFSVPTPKALYVCVMRMKVMRESKLWRKTKVQAAMRGERRRASPAPQ